MANYDELQMIIESARLSWDKQKAQLNSENLESLYTPVKNKRKSEITKKLDSKLHRESVNDIKLEIYESCYNGEITEEERDDLLTLVQEGFIDKIKSKITNKKDPSIKEDPKISTIPSVKDEINRLKNINKETKNDKDKINEAKQKLLEARNKMNNINMTKVVATTESTSIEDIKLVIFESWYVGEITEDERNELLSMI